jgi:signal transduction histidine kinase
VTFKHTILLVDDERENLNLLANVLGDDYFIHKSRQPEEALAFAKSRPVHLVISDQRMPGMTGVHLLEKIREVKPDTVRILITAYPDVNVAVDAINRGQVKRYVNKPFDPDELRVVVRQELENYELAQANRRLGSELGRVVEELLRVNKELKELDRMKDHFLSNVSHELKTPLVSGMGYLDLALGGGMGAIDPKMEKGLRVAYRNLERLLGLIEDLLALARMRYRPESLTLTTFDLSALVDECVDSLNARSKKTALDVRVVRPRRLPPVAADERKIHSVFTNVLSNAEKFTPDRARIDVKIVRRGSRAVVTIADNGVGIETPSAGGEFPFFKHAEDASVKKYGGLGIGLMLARQVLQAHGCSISLERGRAGGTVVTFDLPLAE